MDGLTKRQTEFILACFKAQQAQQGTFGDPGYFNHVRAGIDAGFSKGECFDLVHLLAEYKPSLMEVHRTSKEIEGNVSGMTGAGREVAGEILAGGAWQRRIGYPRGTLGRAVETAGERGWVGDNAGSEKIPEQGRRAAKNIQKNLKKPLPAAPARGTGRVTTKEAHLKVAKRAK